MNEPSKGNRPVAAPNGDVKIQLDVGKEAIKARFVKAKELGVKESNVNQFKMAVCAFILDAAGVVDKEKRKQAWTLFGSTSGSFGSNVSGYNQDNGFRVAKDNVEGYVGEI